MNWIKKQLNKLFSTIDDENEYDEKQEVMEEEQRRQTEQMKPQSRSSFRFPLIADEEINMDNFEQEKSEKGQPIDLPNYSYNQLTTTQVYDVEVSRIGELLAERRDGKNKQKRESVKPFISTNSTLPLSNRERPKKMMKKEEIPLTRETINPLENRKRFVPTEVPSPVHGFKKPSSIHTLLVKKETVPNDEINDVVIDEENSEELNYKQYEQTNNDHIQEEMIKVTQEVASSAVTNKEMDEIEQHDREEYQESNKQFIEESSSQTILVDEVVESVVYTEQTELDLIEEQELSQEEVPNEKEVVNLVEETIEEVQLTEITPEEEPITVETIIQEESSNGVEWLTENTKIIPPSNEEQAEVQQQENEDPTEKKRGTIPFNVIMLKSDKEKLLKKIETEQLLQNKVEDVKESKQQEQLQYTQVAKLLERAGQDKDEIVHHEVEHVQDASNLTVENNETMDKKIEENTEFAIDENNSITESEQLEQPAISTKSTDDSELENNEQRQHLEEQEQTNSPTLPQKIYVKPSLEYLAPPEENTIDQQWMESQADVLVESLSYFQVTAQVESIVQGPAVTQFEITVGQGTKVSKIRNLADDLKLALAAKDIRIQAPIPGKSTIGIEIPNRISRAVQLSEITQSESFTQSESPLEAALGLDLTGKPITIDLRKMPHGMIAGATGSGKSVCINSILVSLLYKADPQELKLMLIDPKMVELAPFNHIPHLVSPVITDVKAATAALKWAVDEMERRYKLFAHVGVRDISRFNKQAEQNEEYGHKLPYILIVIDELADLMMMSPADVEEAICRIAQKARACGIHLIIATQRPSVDVITGLIKSNIPTRIAFAVSSQVDSRTILDQQGAERLLGRGDMLYLGNGMSAPIRIQGTFVTDDEIEQIVDHVRQQGEPDYIFEQDELLKKAEMIEEYDELFEEVCRFVYEQGSASTSSIQRRFHIGYNRAARLVDMLESHGFVSEAKGSRARDVFMTESDLTKTFG